MPLLLRSIRSGKRRALLTELDSIGRQMMGETLDKQVKPALVKSHDKVVESWKNKPTFQARKYIRPDKFSVTVFPTGDAAEIYTYVDQGTRPHLIMAKNVPYLKFRTGYSPKTLPNPARVVIHPQGGKSTGPWVSAKVVHHPGSEPRKFSEAIARDIEPEFKRVIENTFRAIARKLEE